MSNQTGKGRVDLQRSNVIIIEPSREMQRLLRAMLFNYGIRDVRTYADSERATNAMLSEPPDIVILDWDSTPFDGSSFLKLFRHQNMYPVCLVPIVVMFSEPRQRSVESALKLGAHAVVAKPMAPAMLHARMTWALSGEQKLRLLGNRYVIEGVTERLAGEKERQSQMASAREYQASQFAEMMAIQNDVDRILQVNL